MSSAYSDDGQTRTRIRQRNVDDHENLMNPRINAVEEPDTGVSITAELSERRADHRQRPDEDEDAISERPDESDNRSSPPGTIGEPHDIMSENIESHFQFRKSNKIPYTQIVGEFSDEGVSKEANKSAVTKVSAVAHVSPPIALQETSRSIQTFSLVYDRLFKNF